ncbi:MAG TPA: glycosyltransferase family 9 protein [Rhodanobacteraceae bacterium]|nr:glycosyltransferase family 9 protein [Rhodanobacteraceae bacterium]
MKAPNLQRALDRKRYSELRRRLLRRILQPWLGAGTAAAALVHGTDATAIHRVLICRPNHRLGNLLLLTPLVAELQRLLPHATVDIVLAGDHGPELFQGFPNVRHVYCLARRMVRHPFATGRVALQMRRAHYDLAIDPCEASQSSRLLAALAQPRQLLGMPRKPDSEALPPAWARSAPVHMAQWPVYLLRTALRCPLPARAFPVLEIRLSDDERRRGRETVASVLRERAATRTTLGVFAEATGTKRFSLDWWRRFMVAAQVHHPTLAFVEIVPADGRARLAPEIPGFGSPNPREVAAAIAGMDGCVSADCGVMHLANAAGVPTFGLFVTSNLARYAPYGHGSRGLATAGEAPEVVAQRAVRWIEALTASRPTGDRFHVPVSGDPTRPVPVSVPPVVTGPAGRPLP